MYMRSIPSLPALLMQVARLFYEIPYRIHQFSFSPKYFRFQGMDYQYFVHPYNATWRNERAVELPIACAVLSGHKPSRVLELGNVLSHYQPVSHTVVDKYEFGRKIISQDILEYAPSNSYDLIISVSTLEHVGWDETPRDPGKPRRVVSHLSSLLSADGRMILTIPLGYNPALDRNLADRNLGFSNYYFLRRIGKEEWVESSWEDARESRYGMPFTQANGLAICTLHI